MSDLNTFYILRVLIVDDNPSSVATLKNCFQSCGCIFKVTTSGHEAVKELSSHHRYDLVILDWKMPDMTGRETLLEIQKQIDHDSSLKAKWSNRKVPVLVYTGFHVKDVEFPSCRNFRSVGVWDKLVPYSKLLPRASEVLEKLAG
jgi:CheY-like chemotaxis protein